MSLPNSAPSRQQLQQLTQVRRAALLRKWTSGQKLTDHEMAEIADILPPGLLANPPLPRSGCRKQYQFYATEIGVDVRTIKDWVGIGKKARLMPPLDEPPLLPDWWEQMKLRGLRKQSCPQSLLEYAAKHPPAAPFPSVVVGGGVEEKAAVGEKSSAASGAPNSKIKVEDLEAVGLAAAVRELSLQLAGDQLELRKARENGEGDLAVSRRQKAFGATLDALRKTEESYQKLQEARGELAPVNSFRADLTTIMTTLRGMMRRRADNIAKKLAADLTAEQLVKLRGLLEAEAAREEVQLRTAKHWKRNPDGTVVE